MIRGAGILYLAPDNKVLFLKRGAGGDYPGFWAFPGGQLEEGETLEECAVRESREEIGTVLPGPRELLARSISQGEPLSTELLPGQAAPGEQVDFTTFLQRIKAEDAGTNLSIDGEHVGVAWAPADQPPEPLHPGCRIALAKLTANELGIARMMAAGELTSPQRYMNVWLWAMRITGTGASHRSAVKDKKTGKIIREAEYVWRKPENYLNDEFLARCNGLTVIWIHPPKATLNSKEFSDRVIGSIFLPYIKGDEVWGISKIYDDDANAAMLKDQLSTSPTVVLGDPNDPGMILRTEDGDKINVEGAAKLHDHLAIVPAGVWDKGGEPAGVLNQAIGDSIVTEEEKKAAEDKARKDAAEKEEKEKADARARADAEASTKMDKLADSVSKMADAFGEGMKKMDAVCARMDAFEAKGKGEEKDDARKDGESEEAWKERTDKKRKDAAEAKAKADAEEEEKKKEDAARKDAEEKAKADSAELANVKAEVAALKAQMKPRTPADRAVLADLQSRADSVMRAALGSSAPAYMDGEDAPVYKRRLIRDLLPLSRYKDKAENILGMADEALFDTFMADVYADAEAYARRPGDDGTGQLRKSERVVNGHTHIEWFGSPKSWMSDFGGKAQRARGDFKVPN
jgi:8-oxo-dGTP pyrophosphatase MutT (NUDIX family)